MTGTTVNLITQMPAQGCTAGMVLSFT